MKTSKNILFLTLVMAAATLLLTVSCHDVPVVEISSPAEDTLRENLINANRYIAGSEATQIDSYIERRGWQMKRLAGGARVMETHPGKGRHVDYEDTLSINYTLEAIDGKVIYRNVCDTVVAGHLQPTRGLDAALRSLSHGSEAVVILPSEQGYGVAGDGERVGPRMILIYKIKINN